MNSVISSSEKRVFPLQNNTLQYIASIQGVSLMCLLGSKGSG